MLNCFTKKPPWGSEIKYMYVCTSNACVATQARVYL